MHLKLVAQVAEAVNPIVTEVARAQCRCARF